MTAETKPIDPLAPALTPETQAPDAPAPEMTQEQAFDQLPPEVQGSIGHLETMGKMFVVRLPDAMVTIGGKPQRQKRYLSMNGNDIRAFHSKDHALQTLRNYQQLMVARAAMRMELQEQDQKILQESIEEMQQAVPNESPQPATDTQKTEGGVDWPAPADYDPSKVTGKMFTGTGIDEGVAREVSEDAAKLLTPEAWNATNAEA